MPLVRIALLVYLGLGIVLFFSQRSLLYYPSATTFGECPALADTRAQTLENGARGYFKHVSDDRIAILYHGNAGSACDRALYGRFFEQQGYSFFIAEYAGYGNDPRGGPGVDRILTDVEATATHFQTQDFTHLVLIGKSLGASTAAYHAKLAPPDALILITPMVSTIERAQEIYPFYPANLLLRERYNTLAWLKDTPSLPITFIHGTQDNVVPSHHSTKLYNALMEHERDIVLIDGADHNRLVAYDAFWNTLQNALQQGR